MSKKIMPCPFCGGKGIVCNNIMGHWGVFCEDCHAVLKAGRTEAEAISKWNTRQIAS